MLVVLLEMAPSRVGQCMMRKISQEAKYQCCCIGHMWKDRDFDSGIHSDLRTATKGIVAEAPTLSYISLQANMTSATRTGQVTEIIDDAPRPPLYDVSDSPVTRLHIYEGY